MHHRQAAGAEQGNQRGNVTFGLRIGTRAAGAGPVGHALLHVDDQKGSGWKGVGHAAPM